MDEGGSKAEEAAKELAALITARDVLQKQIDERVALRRQEMLSADSFYRERKTRRLAAYFSDLGFRIVSCVGKEQVLVETRAANLLFKIKEIALPIFKKLVAKGNKEVSAELDCFGGSDKNSLLQLCDAFEKLKWIKTERTKHVLRIVRLNDTAATCFWHGSWAEYVNRSLVVKTLQAFANSRKCRFDVFHDVRLAKCEPTGKPIDMQLDLVAQLNDRFYVFDTKTGVLCIDKWVDRARLFSAARCSRFITCCADEDIPPRLFEPYTLIPLGQLETRLMDVLNEDFADAKVI
jgi:hypothetical protein